MQFNGYTKIENLSQGVIGKIFHFGFSELEYVVQEKVHGANFSFITDGKDLECSKRTRIIKDNESFFTHEKVVDENQNKILALFKDVKVFKPNIKYITVYGELFGGSYFHPDVKQDSNCKQIQKGIDYSPINGFYAFDILVDGEEFLDVITINDLFEKHKIFYAKTLFRGSFEECIKYPNSFNSKIPEWLGYPSLEKNICEGVVIKPIIPQVFASGKRVAIKNKNSKWSEKGKKKEFKPIPEISEELIAIAGEISKYVTENRLRNVISKIGKIEASSFGKLQGMFQNDIFNDFALDNNAYETLSKVDQRSIRQTVGMIVTKMIRDNIHDIIDGEF